LASSTFGGESVTENWGLLVLVLAIAVANMPALIHQYRTDRPGFKPIEKADLAALLARWCGFGDQLEERAGRGAA